MPEFSFRPNLLRSDWVFRLENDELTCFKDAAQEWRAALSKVTRAAFVSYKTHGRMIWRLDLITAEKAFHINCNLPASGAHETEDFSAFQALAAALSERLQDLHPDMQIGFGEHGRARKVMFGIGIVSAVGGGGMFLAAMATGVSSSRLTEAAVPMLGMVILGGLLVRSNNPWKAPPNVPLSLFPQLLIYLAGGTVDSTQEAPDPSD